jgi:hypothetical protein
MVRKLLAGALVAAFFGGVTFVVVQRPAGRISCAARPAILLLPEKHCWRDPSIAVR